MRYPYILFVSGVEIGAFKKLSYLHDYAYSLVSSLSNNYTWDSLHAYQVKKKFLRKERKVKLNWREIEYEIYEKYEEDEEDED